jgi:hypothetical protein
MSQGIQVGTLYPNIHHTPHSLIVKLDLRRLDPDKYYSVVSDEKYVDCKIDTGAFESFFTGRAARDLSLDPPVKAAQSLSDSYETEKDLGLAFSEQVAGVFGQSARDAWWCYSYIGIIEPSYSCLAIRVRFPLNKVRSSSGVDSFQWDYYRLDHNLIGMRGLAGQRMLCITSEALLMIARTRLEP